MRQNSNSSRGGHVVKRKFKAGREVLMRTWLYCKSKHRILISLAGLYLCLVKNEG